MDLLIATRFVHFAATLITGGTIWFALAMPHGTPAALRDRLRQFSCAALLIAIASGVVWWTLVATTILDVPASAVWQDGWTVLTGTRFGQVSGARGALALVLLFSVIRRDTRASALLALPLVALPALTGHTGAMPGWTGYGYMLTDMAHLVAAALWLGALPAFGLLLAAGADDAVVVEATRRFGLAALISVAVLVASGALNSWHLLNGPSDLVDTAYGRLLSIKLALLAAMLVLAAVNRFRLTPALPAAKACRRLIRNIWTETALGLGVIALVAILGTLPPGGHAHVSNSLIPDEAAFVHIHGLTAMADVTVVPGRRGRPTLTIRLAREDFSAFPARDVRVALYPPGGAPTSSTYAAAPEDQLWRVPEVDLPVPGVWSVRVLITPVMGEPLVLDAPLVIAP